MAVAKDNDALAAVVGKTSLESEEVVPLEAGAWTDRLTRSETRRRAAARLSSFETVSSISGNRASDGM
jgi:hypothetical protein